jgi:hypothetical protein
MADTQTKTDIRLYSKLRMEILGLRLWSGEMVGLRRNYSSYIIIYIVCELNYALEAYNKNNRILDKDYILVLLCCCRCCCCAPSGAEIKFASECSAGMSTSPYPVRNGTLTYLAIFTIIILIAWLSHKLKFITKSSFE